MQPADISIVIPTRNEAQVLPRCVESAWAAGASEIIVSDGGSDDATADVAVGLGVSKLIRSLPGRGVQLNAGAFHATGKCLLFLHADCRLHSDCLHQIASRPDAPWGAFGQHIDSPRTIYRWIEKGNRLRIKGRSMAYGDQAMFIHRDWFKRVGGFAEIEFLEDVDLSRRLRREVKACWLPGPVTVSPRRWESVGPVRQTARNWRILVAYRFGVSPRRLKTWYRG